MKNLTKLVIGSFLITASATAFSWGWGGNAPWDDNDWPEWTPMYWMEEMFDDNDDYWGGPYGYYGAPYGNYGAPYGYGYRAPYYGPSYYPYGAGYPSVNPNMPTTVAPSATK